MTRLTDRLQEREAGLFFDTAGFMGWALMGLSPSMPLLASDTFHLSFKDAPGEWSGRWIQAATEADRLVRLYSPRLIGFEAPFLPPQESNDKRAKFGGSKFRISAETVRFLIGLAAMIEVVAKRHAIPCREVPVQTNKATLAGAAKKIEVDKAKAQFQRVGIAEDVQKEELRIMRKIDKSDMVDACFARGWKVKSEHEADACGVGLVCISRYLADRRPT